jgi:uncharacterized SAM-binding protein YcdF (DUF218 family)
MTSFFFPRKRPTPTPRRKRLRSIVAALLIVVLGFGAATVHWLVMPRQGIPSHVDAIVMLNGPGDRLETALNLAWAHRAPVIVISRGSRYWGHGSVCAPKIPRVTVICFDPSPPTTRGEAEFAGRLARRYHWRSIALVAVASQDTVARLRVGSCFSGKIYVINASLPASQWPYEIVHEWGSTLKAFFTQRSC